MDTYHISRPHYHNNTIHEDCSSFNYHELAREYCPVFVLAKDEKYRACSAEHIIENSQLYRGDDVLFDFGTNNIKLMSDNMGDNIKISPDIYVGTANAPIYYYLIYGDKYIDIVYFLYFAYNEGYRVFGKLKGDHEGDIEYIVQRFKISDNSPVAVYFSAHGDEGRWIEKEKVEYSNKNPIVYVARGSHAMYHRRGTHIRVVGLANDKTSNGDVLTGGLIHVSDKYPLWMKYRGQWSRDGIDSVATRSWWRCAPTHNSNWFTRLFPTSWVNRHFMKRAKF
jgi:hypothetical protein